jgi:hypothetical protein
MNLFYNRGKALETVSLPFEKIKMPEKRRSGHRRGLTAVPS